MHTLTFCLIPTMASRTFSIMAVFVLLLSTVKAGWPDKETKCVEVRTTPEGTSASVAPEVTVLLRCSLLHDRKKGCDSCEEVIAAFQKANYDEDSVWEECCEISGAAIAIIVACVLVGICSFIACCFFCFCNNKNKEK
eukprot:m.29045 g.29045  ORF g.29045 m.29045 type:complete len:138 (+) comp8058_c0_seq1:165-578(+)